jgi:hypothetical protein
MAAAQMKKDFWACLLLENTISVLSIWILALTNATKQ